jgi:hypothetical protein
VLRLEQLIQQSRQLILGSVAHIRIVSLVHEQAGELSSTAALSSAGIVIAFLLQRHRPGPASDSGRSAARGPYRRLRRRRRLRSLSAL